MTRAPLLLLFMRFEVEEALTLAVEDEFVTVTDAPELISAMSPPRPTPPPLPVVPVPPPVIFPSLAL